MSKFINTTDGLLNTNRIVLVRQLSEPRKVGPYLCHHLVQYSEDGQSHTAYTWEHDLAVLTDEIIPASPGYFVVRACGDDDGNVLPPEPVIAWRIRGDGASIVPVLVDGAADGYTNIYGVLRPDGTVDVPHHCRYDSLEEFKSYVAEEARTRAKASRKAASA
jgi:hypothetical protein